MLIVYVDDFKLSGPTANLPAAWRLIRKNIEMGDPAPQGRYLGCNHIATSDHTGSHITYDMKDFLVQCIEKYVSVCPTEVKLKHVPSPGLDESTLTDDDYEAPGSLASSACSVLMKILYAARAARWDLLKSVCYLAGKVTKWTRACDTYLFRFICWINSSLN
jgi:hypothetical protein